jgi:hypothetical protein
MIQRNIQKNIEKWLFKEKVIILYGARQVGKTTLVKNLLEKYKSTSYFSCDHLQVQNALEKADPLRIKSFLGDSKLIVLDEAQKILNIGTILKIMVDTYPDTQIIATGSASFDLANKINEPLTGRSIEFTLSPLSLSEISQGEPFIKTHARLEEFLKFGMYPEIILSESMSHKIRLLDNISSNSLYKDIFELENIKKPKLLLKLLELLAMQLGNEVSIHELAVTLQCSRDLVEKYLDLLEKSFVLFRLRPLSRNLRSEITKKQKIYFYDLGIRNSILHQYNDINLRTDIGALWENFLIIERLKYLQTQNSFCNKYFWRTKQQKEIDYLEEYNQKISAYEFKWKKKPKKIIKEFLEAYPESSFQVIHTENYWEWVM